MAGSMQKLGNGKYKFTVSAGFKIGRKRNRFFRTVTAKDDDEARKLLDLFDAEVRAGMILEPSTLILKEYLEKWHEHISMKLKPKTLLEYRKLFKKTFESLGHIRVQKLKPTHMNEFYALLLSDGLSGESVRHYHRMLSSALQTAVKWGIVNDNAVKKADPPKSDTNEIESYDLKQVAQVIEALESEPIQWRILCLITIALGLRRGEICGLMWDDINCEENTLTVNRAATYIPKTGIILTSPKSKSGKRIISIPDDLMAEILAYKEYQKEKYSKLDGEPQYIFSQATGSPLFPDSVSDWWGKFVKRHSLPKLTFHGLRHTSATLLITSGVDINTLQKRLGHADPSMTFRYLHQTRDADRIASQKINDIMAIGIKVQPKGNNDNG